MPFTSTVKTDCSRRPFVLPTETSLTSISTAEIVANSPRFRRKSSIFVDAIHDLPEKADLAPAQLYSTESGRLFHSGRIVIITVGLPARGKTYANPAPTEPFASGSLISLFMKQTYFSCLSTISPMVCFIVADPGHSSRRIMRNSC